MPKTLHGPRLSTLILLSALGILPINIFLPSLTNMAAEFGVDYGVVALALAAYAAVSACLQIIMGPLSDRFGRRPVILWGLAIFVIATIGCVVAPDLWTFLACRMIQAVIAPTYSVSLAVIRDTTSKKRPRAKSAMSRWRGQWHPCLGRAWAVCSTMRSDGGPASGS
jgi:MFS family permease